MVLCTMLIQLTAGLLNYLPTVSESISYQDNLQYTPKIIYILVKAIFFKVGHF